MKEFLKANWGWVLFFVLLVWGVFALINSTNESLMRKIRACEERYGADYVYQPEHFCVNVKTYDTKFYIDKNE